MIKIKLETHDKVISEGRSNIGTTIAMMIRKIAINYCMDKNLDFNKTYTIDIKKDFAKLAELSKKFDKPIEYLKIATFVTTPHYDPPTKAVQIYMDPGYTMMDMKIYNDSLENEPATKEQFDQDLADTIKHYTERLSEKPYNIPKFTKSNLANEKNLEKLRDSQFSSFSHIYIKPEDVEQAIKRCQPNSKERRDALEKNLKPGTKKFQTLKHEVQHGRHFAQGTADNPFPFAKQLNKHFAEENFPAMPLDSYVNRQVFLKDPFNQKTNDLSFFFYITRPAEIDARISAYRDFYHSIKKEARKEYKNSKKSEADLKKYNEAIENRGEKIFQHISKEENFNLGMNLIKTRDQKITNELTNKAQHQFYHQLKKTAPDIFSKSPKFQEALDKYKENVSRINSEISNKASEEDKKLYKFYSWPYKTEKEDVKESKMFYVDETMGVFKIIKND